MSERIVAPYLDDLAIPGRNNSHGLENFRKVLTAAEENILLINWILS